MRPTRILSAVLLAVVTIIAATFYVTTAVANDKKILDVTYTELTKDAKREVDCLADNIYHEAGYESEKGKVAVALVTLNRVEDPRFPKNICGVVKQKTNSTCQFSWFCQSAKVNRSSEAYQAAKDIAVYVYANYEKLYDVTKGALYYHADYVNPGWKLQKTVTIGRHIFYKEGGKRHDEKAKSTTERRFGIKTLFLPNDGRDKSIDL